MRGRGPGGEPSGEARSAGAPSAGFRCEPGVRPPLQRPPHSAGAVLGWRGPAGGTQLGRGNVDGLLQAPRGVLSPPARTRAGAAVGSPREMERWEGEPVEVRLRASPALLRGVGGGAVKAGEEGLSEGWASTWRSSKVVQH